LRRPLEPGQSTAIRFTQRLVDAGARPSMGSVGDSYDTQSMIMVVRSGSPV
jgi:putative transposase